MIDWHRGGIVEAVDLDAHTGTQKLLQPVDNVFAKLRCLQDLVVAADTAQ